MVLPWGFNCTLRYNLMLQSLVFSCGEKRAGVMSFLWARIKTRHYTLSLRTRGKTVHSDGWLNEWYVLLFFDRLHIRIACHTFEPRPLYVKSEIVFFIRACKNMAQEWWLALLVVCLLKNNSNHAFSRNLIWYFHLAVRDLRNSPLLTSLACCLLKKFYASRSQIKFHESMLSLRNSDPIIYFTSWIFTK